jgi:carbamoyl-phosphate synthase large subunit
MEAKKTVLIIPGSQYQLPLIRKAQARGYRVTCADRDPNCPGSREADDFHPIGLDERDALLHLARTIQPIGIVTDQTDAGVSVVAWLSEQLGLRGIGERCARLFTEKHRMREFGRTHGFPTPEFLLSNDFLSAQAAAAAIGFPVVIKPITNQASKGVHRVDTPEDLAKCYADAAHYSRFGEVLVEQFIDGVEFTVEGFMGEGGHQTLGISEKAHYPLCPMVACSLRFTPSNSRFDYAELRRTNDSWINQTQLPFGMTHAEYKFSRGRYYLIEVATRGGGTRIASDIVPWISGVDYQGLMLDAVLEPKTTGTRRAQQQRCALLEFFQFTSGQVTAIQGVDEAKLLPGVLDVVLPCTVGGFLPNLTDDTTRPGYFILQTNSEGEMQQLRKRVLDMVRVQTE